MSDPGAYRDDPLYTGLSEYQRGLIDRAVVIVREEPGITQESLYLDHGINLQLAMKLSYLKKLALD